MNPNSQDAVTSRHEHIDMGHPHGYRTMRRPRPGLPPAETKDCWKVALRGRLSSLPDGSCIGEVAPLPPTRLPAGMKTGPNLDDVVVPNKRTLHAITVRSPTRRPMPHNIGDASACDPQQAAPGLKTFLFSNLRCCFRFRHVVPPQDVQILNSRRSR